MKIYFECLILLQQFTLNLNTPDNVSQCQKCLVNGQFISHGFVYKYQNSNKKKIVGKRVFCSNRNGRSGCGGTIILYLSETIPRMRFNTEHMTVFLFSLLKNFNIQQAYQSATKTKDPRNAYRWLHKLQNKLMNYRLFLKQRTVQIVNFKSRNQRLQLLLPTIQSLFSKLGQQSCQQYQQQCQASFV